jgi:hypothetical protein
MTTQDRRIEFCEWLSVIHETYSKFTKQALRTDEDKTGSKSTQAGTMNTQNKQQKKSANVLIVTVWEGRHSGRSDWLLFSSKAMQRKVTWNFGKAQ